MDHQSPSHAHRKPPPHVLTAMIAENTRPKTLTPGGNLPSHPRQACFAPIKTNSADLRPTQNDAKMLAMFAAVDTQLSMARQQDEYKTARNAHLRAIFDDAERRASMDEVLDALALAHVNGEMSMVDIEIDVRRIFGVELRAATVNSVCADASHVAMSRLLAKLQERTRLL